MCFYLVTFYKEKILSAETQSGTSDLDMLTFDGLSVLHLPSINFKHQTLHYLLQEFPGQLWIRQKGGEHGQTPLHYSCVHGFTEGVKLLLEFGAEWLDQDLQGNTCLHLCFQYGHRNCIEALIQYIFSSNPNIDDSEALLEALETVKNNKGWLATDLSASFTLISEYKNIKADLLLRYTALAMQASASSITIDSGSYQGSIPTLLPTVVDSQVVLPEATLLHSNQPISFELPPQVYTPNVASFMENSPVSSTSYLSSNGGQNRILTSPMVLVKNEVFTRSKARAQLLSLPQESASLGMSSVTSPLPFYSKSSSSGRPSVGRQRSNTTQGPVSSQTTMLRPSPRIPKTPSLKSIAFSPLVREKLLPRYSQQQSQLQHGSPLNSASPSQKADPKKRGLFFLSSRRPSVTDSDEANIKEVEEVDVVPTSRPSYKSSNESLRPRNGSRKSSLNSMSSLTSSMNHVTISYDPFGDVTPGANTTSNSSKSSLNTFADLDSPRKNNSILGGPNKRISLQKAKSETAMPPLNDASQQLRVSTSTTILPLVESDEDMGSTIGSIAFNSVR